MADEIRLLDQNDFANLRLDDLLRDRSLMRNVHFSLINAIQEKIFEILFFTKRITISEVYPYETKTMCWAFFLADDPGNFYFFDHQYPDDWPLYLRDEDIIWSGIEGPDLSKENLLKALDKLKKQDKVYLRPLSPADIEKNITLKNELDEKGVDWQVGIIARLPFRNTTEVMCAWVAGDKNVAQALGKVRRKFTKPLKRTAGGKVERYNSIKKLWEICIETAELEVTIELAEKFQNF